MKAKEILVETTFKNNQVKITKFFQNKTAACLLILQTKTIIQPHFTAPAAYRNVSFIFQKSGIPFHCQLTWRKMALIVIIF